MEFRFQYNVADYAFSADEEILAVLNPGNGPDEVVLWDTATCEEVKTLTIDGRVEFQNNGTMVRINRNKREIIDIGTGEVKATHELPDGFVTNSDFSLGCRITKDNAIEIAALPSVRVFAATGKQMGSIGDVQFSPDGRLLAANVGGSKIKLWDVPPPPSDK